MIAQANRPDRVTFSPGLEFFPVQQIGTFQGMASTIARTYRDYDTALRDSLDNARYMRTDCGVMECLEARMRAVALLDWVIEPEDDKSPAQKRLCEEMTKILARTPRFTEFRRCLLEAIWYGKYGVQVKYRPTFIAGKRYFAIAGDEDQPDVPQWSPVNGDKIIFRHDDVRNMDASKGQHPFQVGIRVGMNWKPGEMVNGRYPVEKVQTHFQGAEPVDRGMAYFLDRESRRNFVIHKHSIEDGAYEDMLSAGSIHGVGVRSRIYWDWVQLQTVKSFLLAYMERTHGGLEIYKFPLGNKVAEDAIDDAIRQRVPGRGALKVPVPNGEDANQYGVEIVEAGMSGVSFMLDLMKDYYGHRIKRYILGQILSTEAEGTGMGSGVADLHLESFLQILKYDAVNFDDTMTDQPLRWLQVSNFPSSRGIRLRYKTVTEDTDQDKKMQALQDAWNMGARVKESDVFDVCGLSAPSESDRILSSPGQSPQPSPFAPQ